METKKLHISLVILLLSLGAIKSQDEDDIGKLID